ncbi:MAG: 4Fe-4S binding protein [Candidatus Ranarchaeia archaeon]
MTQKTVYDPKHKPGWKDIAHGAPSFISGDEYHTGSWRSFRPVYSAKDCINCGQCWISCPDDAIIWEPNKRKAQGDKTAVITYVWQACKGCGVCAEVCPKEAIIMTREKEEL